MKRLYTYAFLNGLQFTYTTWLAYVLARGGNPGWAEAAFHLGILLGEVPTGAVADLLGRRTSMLMGLLLGAAVSGSYFFIHGTVAACVLMFISGLAGTFLSGADTALLYETAVAEGGTQFAQKALARSSALQIGALAISPAIAGFLYQWHDWAPSMARAAIALITVAVVWSMRERPVQRDGEHPGILGQTAAAVKVLRTNRAAWLLILFGWAYNTAVAMTGQYSQAYFPFVGMSMGAMGIVYALGQGSGTLGGAVAERLSRTAGGRMLRFAPLFMALAYITMGGAARLGGSGALIGAACLVASQATDGIVYPLSQHRLNETIPSAQRATVLSLQSAGVSLLMAVSFPAASYLAVPSIYLVTGTVAAVLAVVWMLRRWSY